MVSASAESRSFWVLLRSVCKRWHPARKQTTSGWLCCHWSKDLLSGLIACLWASLPQQREVGSVSNRIKQHCAEDGWGWNKAQIITRYWNPEPNRSCKPSEKPPHSEKKKARGRSYVSLQRWCVCSTPYMDHQLRKMGLFREEVKKPVLQNGSPQTQ